MKRRAILRTLAASPAASALPAASAAQAGAAPPPVETPKLATASPDAAADAVPHFFTPEQFAALERLADILIPAWQGRPSARHAGAPQFLDFLIRESPAPLQRLYQDGLNRLVSAGFSQASAAGTKLLLAPLTEPWRYEGPSDPFARFLLEAKVALFQATINSREFAETQTAGRRGAASTNYYWRYIE